MVQRVMITAGGSGIGLAIAKAFVANGATVHVCDVDERAITEAGKEPGIVATRVNVSDETAVDRWFKTATKDLGGLDVLVNNAGVKGPTGNVEELSYADWRDCSPASASMRNSSAPAGRPRS